MAECIVAIERSVCEIAQSLIYLAKYCYNIAAIYNINHYIFNYYIYIYFTYLGTDSDNDSEKTDDDYYQMTTHYRNERK